MAMKTYREFSPSQHDTRGLGLPNRQSWYVVPVAQNRDSPAYEVSNFRVALRMLGGELEDVVEVHRFGHWACGWFEIILISPDAEEKVLTAREIESKLENYPLLDEDDVAELEYEENSDDD